LRLCNAGGGKYTDRMEVIQAIDQGTTFALTTFQLDNPWLVPLVRALADAGHLWVLGPIAVLAWIHFILNGRWRTGLLIVLAFLTSSLLCLFVQPLVGRPRPEGAWVVPGRPAGFGFPSEYAAASAATYGLMALSSVPLMKRRVWQSVVGFGVVGLVLAIGFSQMFLAWSYLSDVVGGWALGLSLALLFRWLDLVWTQAAASSGA
jgi:membrane-associated phospholipid phosphatase